MGLRGAATILDWLHAHPGEGRQDRWTVSGVDRGTSWIDTLAPADTPQAWQPVISCTGPGRSEEHEVAGALTSGVTDHIQEIAEILSECLTRAEHEARRREQYERPDPPVNTGAMSWPDPYPAGIAVRAGSDG